MSRVCSRSWLPRWLQPRHCSPQPSRPKPPRSWLHIDGLEDRCVPSTVTNLSDHGPGSLRDAIAITPAGETVDFQNGLSGTITLTSGGLVINKNLTISGPGADVITVSGNHASGIRVFDIATTCTVELSGLTIAAGAVGIGNAGTLTITSSTVRGNARSSDGGTLMGSGIYNTGSLTIADSTINDNSLSSSGHGPPFPPPAEALGGGIYNSGTLTITDSTITGNSVYATSAYLGSGLSRGGGIYSVGTLTIEGSTISGNRASAGYGSALGGGIFNYYATEMTHVRNTIVAGNTAGDLFGVFSSLGHNLIGNSQGGSGFTDTDLLNVDPMLGPLQDNGGPTQTMALLPRSPAIDAGDNTDSPEWDQRGPGYPRIVNDIIDIGAFEVQQAVAPSVTCAVAQPRLLPPNHRLVNVGLSVSVTPPDATLQVQVYANDHADAADLADVGPDTLRLRAERTEHGLGRVYLIVVTATTSGGSAFEVCSVVVPHSNNPFSISIVRLEAFFAEGWYRLFQTAPPGFHWIGEAPDGGSGAPSAGQSGQNAIPGDTSRLNAPVPATILTAPNQQAPSGAADASVPAEHLLATWAFVPVDRYFADAHGEGLRPTMPRLERRGWENCLGRDLVLKDGWLAV